MKKGPRRSYRQTARAEAAQETARRAMQAAFSLWREKDFDEITLAEIADRAEITVQTLIRRFGSKQGLLEACLAQSGNEVDLLRMQAPVGDVETAIAVLMEHYERDGDAVLRTLALEQRSPAAAAITRHGRAEHRAWCERVFGPHLAGSKGAARAARLDAFVAATDIYLWKLWRLDLGRSPAQTKRAWSELL